MHVILLKLYTKHKLKPKTTQYIFLDHPPNFKGYIYYNPLTKQTIVSRHVTFANSNTFHPNPNPILIQALDSLPY